MVRGVCRGLSECHKGREGVNIVAPALCYVLGGQEIETSAALTREQIASDCWF